MVPIVPAGQGKGGDRGSAGRASRTAGQVDAKGCSQPFRVHRDIEIAEKNRRGNAFTILWSGDGLDAAEAGADYSDTDDIASSSGGHWPGRRGNRDGDFIAVFVSWLERAAGNCPRTRCCGAVETGHGHLAKLQRRLFGETLQ